MSLEKYLEQEILVKDIIIAEAECFATKIKVRLQDFAQNFTKKTSRTVFIYEKETNSYFSLFEPMLRPYKLENETEFCKEFNLNPEERLKFRDVVRYANSKLPRYQSAFMLDEEGKKIRKINMTDEVSRGGLWL